MLRVLSLFAGIGGIDLGLERAGMKTVAQCEIDPFCNAVLAKHWPNVTRYTDVRTLDGNEWRGRVDVVAGGFPCQDISYHGKGAGIDGDRSGLWREMFRIIREIRPRYVIVENVPALLARGMGRVLGDLASIGFNAQWDCIRASAVGAPHQRDRAFLVAHDREVRTIGRFSEEVRRITAFSWCEDVRGPEDMRKRSAILGPCLCRSGDGIPDRVDRVGALGNAVVPQVVEVIGRWIMQQEKIECQ